MTKKGTAPGYKVWHCNPDEDHPRPYQLRLAGVGEFFATAEEADEASWRHYERVREDFFKELVSLGDRWKERWPEMAWFFETQKAMWPEGSWPDKCSNCGLENDEDSAWYVGEPRPELSIDKKLGDCWQCDEGKHPVLSRLRPTTSNNFALDQLEGQLEYWKGTTERLREDLPNIIAFVIERVVKMHESMGTDLLQVLKDIVVNYRNGKEQALIREALKR